MRYDKTSESPGAVLLEVAVQQSDLGEKHSGDEGHVDQLLEPTFDVELVPLLLHHHECHFV